MSKKSTMTLIKYRVTNFRSVVDSGWIKVDSVTALIGTNESGKTNLLIPLWKLNPANDGEINPIQDYPRKRYGELRDLKEKPTFIEAHFVLSEKLIGEVSSMTTTSKEELTIVSVKRDLGGNYQVFFPQYKPVRTTSLVEIKKLVVDTRSSIESLEPGKSETELKERILATLREEEHRLTELSTETVEKIVLAELRDRLDGISTEDGLKRSTIVPRFGQLLDELKQIFDSISIPAPHTVQKVKQTIVDNLPTFVYYSNYGNLDSEIYLPHVIQNLERKDLGGREEAKVRTLKVLFEFVRLKPTEIHELGRDFDTKQGQPTPEQIKDIAEKKKEREILLQSASVQLTNKFRDWWKQGDYRFRFQADGDHFRIWVSDDRRPEEIELEGRSTGLQWFLSFYLIFLVESKDSHADSIILLDEAGLSLHPLAQRDLSRFFDGLAQTHQILYTTHSPFLIDSNHLDRVNAVYVNDDGATEASQNLRASEATPAQTKSIYAVHAALGLTVSDVILQGCQPVIVEGISDQIYLNTVKNYLVHKGLISPMRELVFMPSGGVRGISSLVSILAAKDEDLPSVIVDSDTPGDDLKKKLGSGTYQNSANKIIQMGDVCNQEQAEVEDLFPVDLMCTVISRYLRGRNDDFSDVWIEGKPIVPQIEAYAKSNGIVLEQGWKVEVARLVKARFFRDGAKNMTQELEEKWTSLFEKILH